MITEWNKQDIAVQRGGDKAGLFGGPKWMYHEGEMLKNKTKQSSHSDAKNASVARFTPIKGRHEVTNIT